MKKKSYGIVDSTLREGEQAPGVFLNDKVRHEIIRLLCKLGVDEIELGVATPLNDYLVGLVSRARSITGGSCRIALWSRCLEEDIAFAASCKPDVLSLSIPASDLHISERLQKDRTWVVNRLAASVQQARDLKIPYISVGLEDGSRADRGFLVQLGRVAATSGCQRIRLADTVGICTPSTIKELVELMHGAVDVELGVHCHNDFGMATGNSVAALESGARWIDATVLGLGERAGNCRLEEVCGYLALMKRNAQYRAEVLPEICSCVAESAQITIAGNHPVVGKNIFTCETGLHQHGIAVNPKTYEPYDPKMVGSSRRLLFGAQAGKRALVFQLAKLGIHLDEHQAKSLVSRVRSGGLGGRLFNAEQLMQLSLDLCRH